MYIKLLKEYTYLLDILGAEMSQVLATNTGTINLMKFELEKEKIKHQQVDGDLLIEIDGYCIKITR